jgi:hypothetical protein
METFQKEVLMAGRPVRREREQRQARALNNAPPAREYAPRQVVHPERFLHSESGSGKKLLEELHQPRRGRRPDGTGETAAIMQSYGVDPSDVTVGPMMWAMLRWFENNRPIYFLDRALAETLTHTEIPMATFDLPVWLPDDGMYIVLPPLFTIQNDISGQHVVEGVYLVKDTVAVSDTRGPAFPSRSLGSPRLIESHETGFHVAPAIMCVGIGKEKPGQGDAIVNFSLMPGTPLKGAPESTFGGIPELIRVICNLLYALQHTTSIERERCIPALTKKQAERRPGRMEAGGKSAAPYTILRIHGTLRSARSTSVPTEGGKLLHPKRISGHFHQYWVLEPGTEKVLDRKPGAGGTLCLVEYLLAPYTQGEHLPPSPLPKTVKVVQNPSEAERRQLRWALSQKIDEINAMRGPEDIPQQPPRIPIHFHVGPSAMGKAPGYDRWVHFRQAWNRARNPFYGNWDAFKQDYIKKLEASFPKK